MAFNFRQRITYKQYKTWHYINTLSDVLIELYISRFSFSLINSEYTWYRSKSLSSAITCYFSFGRVRFEFSEEDISWWRLSIRDWCEVDTFWWSCCLPFVTFSHCRQVIRGIGTSLLSISLQFSHDSQWIQCRP